MQCPHCGKAIVTIDKEIRHLTEEYIRSVALTLSVSISAENIRSICNLLNHASQQPVPDLIKFFIAISPYTNTELAAGFADYFTKGGFKKRAGVSYLIGIIKRRKQYAKDEQKMLPKLPKEFS